MTLLEMKSPPPRHIQTFNMGFDCGFGKSTTTSFRPTSMKSRP